MVNNNVGAVTANIELNTKQFEEAVKKLKGDVKEIKESFTQKTSGNNGLLEEVKSLKKEIDSLREKTKNYQSTLKTVREENSEYAKTIANLRKELSDVRKSQDSFNKGLKEEQTNLDRVTKSAKKYNQELTKTPAQRFNEKNFKNLTNELYSQLSVQGSPKQRDLKKIYKQFEDYYKYLMPSFTDYGNQSPAKNQFKEWFRKSLAEINAEVKSVTSGKGVKFADGIFDTLDASNLKKPFQELNNEITKTAQKVNNVNFTKLSDNIYKNGQLVLNWGKSFTTAQAEIKNATTLVRTELKEVDGEMQKITITVGRVTDVLKTFDYQLLSTADAETKAYERTLELASAMHKMNAQGTSNWSGRQNVGGYSNYIQQTANIQKKQREETQRLRIATNELGTAYQSNVKNLNTYKANISQINKSLEQQRLRTAQLEAAQQSIYYKNAPNNLNTYKMNMDKINQSLEKQTGTHRKNNQEIRRGQMSMREFGTTMGKAEAYSNNLYRGLQKVRSVIVSFKTIMGAMGGMAVWNFAFELVDKAKETYNAKNEMESLLNQNSHVNAEGVQVFNKALDDTISRFQKINKYSLGETAASIGLEFDLNAKEMSESLEVIGMIQNEYIRAGRTTEEAALAVKDILQGEFMRLSRETGVGKEELKDYGWNGDNKDVQSLMKALKKAATDRHWDLFAEKATSINDVINITQNRFGELGADLLTHAEPMIVGAFNGILGAVDSLKSGFEGMGSFGKYSTIFGAGLTAFTGISTALMVLKRNMGLAQIATLGWGRSFGTALLGLNKTDVAMHGFWKTLTATISGTKAAEVANVGLGKSLLARLLGVKANIAGEEGFLKAIMVSQGALRGESEIMTLTSASGLTLSQRLAAVTRNMSATEVKGKSMAWSFGKIITSAKLLKIALLGIAGGAVIAYFASVAQWADTVKKRVETYKDVLSNGKDQIKSTQKDIDNYTSKLGKQESKLNSLTKGTAEYNKQLKKVNLTSQNLTISKSNKEDLEQSLKLAKQIKKEDKETSKQHDLTNKGILNSIYSENGVKNIEKYGQKYQQIKEVAYDIKRSEEARNNFEYASLQHIREHTSEMKKAGASEKDRVKYATEYSTKAEEAADHLKKFNQGDINEGIYFVFARLQLLWIDLWNDKHFIQFWDSVKKTWNDILPTLKTLYGYLINVGHALLDFFSTDFGRWVGTIGLFGTGIGLISLKIGKWVTGSKSVFSVLKKVGGKLKDVATGWKNVGKNAEEAGKKTSETTTSTGGITGGTGGTTSLGTDLKNIGKNRLKSFANNALLIAEGMALVTEAIFLLKAPMWTLSEVGKDFKAQEPQIREGIEGLQLIAPVVGAILIPIIALHQVISRTGNFMSSWGDLLGNLKAFATMAIGIAEGMVLVTEAIGLLALPMAALAGLGWVKQRLGNGVEQGIEAIRVTSDALYALVPWIPVFIGGIAMAASIFIAPEIALPVLGSVALGIATGMAVVTEAILTLHMPLTAIESIGKRYPNLDGVRQGAEAMKLTSEALKYVSDAMGYMTLIDLNLLAQNIDEIVSNWFGIDLGTKLSDLTGEGGVLDQLSDFVDKFNSDEFTIEAPNPDKVTALASAGEGVKTIGDAMVKVKTAMENLPPEFKNGGASVGNQLGLSGNNANGTAQTTTTADSSNYFDAFKEPIKQLKDFIYDFNNSDDFNIEPINADRVANLSTAATMIDTVKQAVDKVKTTMQGIGDSGSAAAFAQGGWFGQIGYNIFHMTGLDAINNGQSSGSYKSSLGSQLQEMENVVEDLFTFQSNITSKSGGDGENANIDGATSMVTQIQDAISKVSTSLSNAVPQFKGKGNALSSALLNGLKQGLNGVSTIGGSIVNKLANGIMTNKNTVYNTANSLGKTTATKFRTGADPMNDYMTWEISYVKKALTERKEELGQDAYNLGHYIASRFKEGDDINSPGIMARSMSDEVGYIRNYLSVNDLPQMAYNLANNLSSNFKLDFGLSNIQLPNLTEFTSKLNVIPSTVANVKTQVSTNFTNMSTNVGTSLQGIANNAKTKYAQVVSNTRTSLANMKSATVKNIGNIKTSWRGMQSALIASAENIKKQTGDKINKLKTNLGEFWNKIKHPDQLIAGGAAGGKPKGSIRRRNRPHTSSYAGSPTLFKPKRSTQAPDDNIRAYLECLFNTDKPCYAGWNFNWTNKIKDKFNGWGTHFNKYNLDSHLNVGKFNKSNFPVKGQADIFKDYVYDVIKGTTYDFYFNSKYGSPAEALRAGHFNCWDGTQIILALARAFGLGGSEGHGTWNGVGHMFARIPGIGVIDPTAIQQNGTFKSPKVKGYSAGSIRRGKSSKLPVGDTYNNDVHVHIHGPVYGVDDLDEKIQQGAEKASRNIVRKHFTRSLSGV